MGQKVNPISLRLGFIRYWSSKWFLDKKIFSIFVEEDYRIRDYIMKFYPRGTVASVIIERLNTSSIKIKIRTSRPGIVIGRRGQEIERLREEISNFTNKEIYIDVEEISQPALEAQLVADKILEEQFPNKGYTVNNVLPLIKEVTLFGFIILFFHLIDSPFCLI